MTTKIHYGQNLLSEAKNKFIFLDTNIYILGRRRGSKLGELLSDLQENGCTFLTIPPVVLEFCRGTATLEDYTARINYIDNLSTIYPIERHLQEQSEQAALSTFTLIISRLNIKNMSYTDFLLAYCLYKLPSAHLMTENHKDFPSSLFNREHIITLDFGDEIQTPAIYTLSRELLDIQATKLLKASK